MGSELFHLAHHVFNCCLAIWTWYLYSEHVANAAEESEEVTVKDWEIGSHLLPFLIYGNVDTSHGCSHDSTSELDPVDISKLELVVFRHEFN